MSNLYRWHLDGTNGGHLELIQPDPGEPFTVWAYNPEGEAEAKIEVAPEALRAFMLRCVAVLETWRLVWREDVGAVSGKTRHRLHFLGKIYASIEARGDSFAMYCGGGFSAWPTLEAAKEAAEAEARRDAELPEGG